MGNNFRNIKYGCYWSKQRGLCVRINIFIQNNHDLELIFIYILPTQTSNYTAY